jgi:1-acyl-sn-glycerol-3-phosphate acyltransferase
MGALTAAPGDRERATGPEEAPEVWPGRTTPGWDAVDEAGWESFPASDPSPWSPRPAREVAADRGPEATLAGDAMLLDHVRRLARELHPARSMDRFGIDASLERDFGLDSLARMELLVRIERELCRPVPEGLVATAETPRDLRRILEAGPVAARATSRAEPTPLPRADPAPESCTTLLEVLDWHVRRHPARRHVLFLPSAGAPQEISYGDLEARSTEISAGLSDLELTPGGRVALMLESGLEYFASFFGILHAGGIPVPLYPPSRPSQVTDHLRRQAGILRTAEAEILVASPEVVRVARLLRAQVETLRRVTTPADLRGSGTIGRRMRRPAQVALVQFTSGSTGDPKGVVLTHGNLLANIRAMGRALKIEVTDSTVSWLPLYHDMGLIGAWLASLYYGLPLTLLTPLTFLARPGSWLRAISEQRATISAAPNFAYELCLSKITDDELPGLDLSSWRLAVNGAEPVSPETVRRFSERFAPCGFRHQAMTPVYGLAESAVGLTFPPPGRGPRIDAIEREPFVARGRASPAGPGDPRPLRFVGCGFPLADHEVRVVDTAGREVEERRQGRLEFRGPSTTDGYFHDPVRTRQLFHDGWLDSGDLAYLAEGEVFLTGRVKDVVIRGGRNIYPEEVEEVVGDLPGIRKGCVAVFGVPEAETGTERLVVLAETREESPSERERLRRRIEDLALELLEMPPDEVALVSPHTVLKTSSGKLRRAATREAFRRGRLGPGHASLRWQLARFAWSGLAPTLRRIAARLEAVLYAFRFWGVVALVAMPAWLTLVATPGVARRRRIARALARSVARLTGVGIAVHGLDHFENLDRWVVAANHSSYLDAFVLSAALPSGGVFLAKRELAGSFFSRVPLERLGTLFVERTEVERGAEDTRVASAAIQEGRSLFAFPEGTFDRSPGLRSFHLGAFVAAAEAGVPVVPVAIRGTRSLLRSGGWFPRRGTLIVIAMPPINPKGTDWNAAMDLRRRARDAILRHCGEPDLESV